MFRRQTESKSTFDQVAYEEQTRAHLADPDALCQSMWTPSYLSHVKCQRPIKQSVPHEHRAIQYGQREAVGWAMPGNYHNDFEKAQIEAEAKAWLGEPIAVWGHPSYDEMGQ